jgi:hypothetical protein
LLQAAVAEADQAEQAWGEVRGILDFENLDGDSLWLLALASRRLGGAGDLSGRTAGLARHTWYANRLLVHAIGRTLSGLGDRGVECLILDELALMLTSYRDLSARSVWSATMFVRAMDGEPALEGLAAAGWRPTGAAVDLLFAPARRIDLVDHDGHRAAVVIERAEPAKERHALDDVWRHACWSEPSALGAPTPEASDGLPPVRTLGPADQLLRTCVEGLRWQGRPAVAWAADLVTLLRAHPGLDWQRVVTRSVDLGVALPTVTALTYVVGVCQVPVPPDALAALQAPASRWSEVLAHRTTGRRRRTAGEASVALAGSFRRWRRGAGGGEVSRFLLALWGLEHRRQIPIVAATKGWRRLRALRRNASPGATLAVGPRDRRPLG